MNTTPQSGPDQRSPGQPPGDPAKKPKKTPAVVLGGAGVLLLAVIVVVVGFWRPWQPRVAEPIFHPAGSQTVWLDDRYAGGSSSWTTADRVLGVSSDRSIIAVASYDTISGLDLHTGQQKWRQDDVLCEVVDGIAYCITHAVGGTEFVRIPLDTGQAESFYFEFEYVTSITALGERDGKVILAADLAGQTRLMAIASHGSQTLEWSASYPSTIVECYLLSTHLGCSDRADSSLFLVDASTGELTAMPEPAATAEQVIWGWDGYGLWFGHPQTQTNPVFDFDHNELGRMHYGLPWVPRELEGVFFTTQDMMLEVDTEAMAVDARGTVVVTTHMADTSFHPSGRGLPGRSRPVGVSADGSLVAVDVDFKRFEIFSRKGTRVHDFGGKTGDMRLVDGIVISQPLGGSATVFAPAG